MNNIYFFTDTEIDSFIDSNVIIIPKNIKSKEALFFEYQSYFEFPDYFGGNWSAFYDVMANIETEKKIIIYHLDLPFSNQYEEKKVCIQTLFDLINFWNNHHCNNILILFSSLYREEITKLNKEKR